MVSPDLQRLRRIAAGLLPGEATDGAEVSRGELHDVVLMPERAVVEVARGEPTTACSAAPGSHPLQASS